MIIADDGNGRRVHISCLFIDLLVWSKLSIIPDIQIKAYFKLPRRKVSKVAVLLSASNRVSYTFLRRLK